MGHRASRVLHCGNADDIKNNPASYIAAEGNVCACGRDPYFPAWPDVLQLNAFQPGLRHLALRVSDFKEAYQRLKDLKVPFLFEPMPGVGGDMVVSFRDPEGNELQIVERKGK